jgi:hypothetical protein
MVTSQQSAPTLDIDVSALSNGEREELVKLGAISLDGATQGYVPPVVASSRTPVVKEAISAANVLNEAYDYSKPSSFSRALTFDIGDLTVLLISGTASVDEDGATIHTGDFRAQCWRTYRNISNLLEAAGLPAGYRAGLSGLQRSAHGLLRLAGARSPPGKHGHPGAPLPRGSPDRDRGHCRRAAQRRKLIHA